MGTATRRRSFGDGMCYRGVVRNGVVQFDPGDTPPDGVAVEVVVIPKSASLEDESALAADLLDLAGSCHGLPADLAQNHDHYLYGAPKQ